MNTAYIDTQESEHIENFTGNVQQHSYILRPHHTKWKTQVSVTQSDRQINNTELHKI